MKALFHINPLFSIEGEGDSQRAVFSQIAELVEVFSVDTCGLCQSHDLVPLVREAQGYTFFEMKCKNCGGRLAYGQSKDMKTLYPRRSYNKKSPEVLAKKVAAGDKLPNGGWFAWNSSEANTPVEPDDEPVKKSGKF